jgi:hypothetical protein
MEVTKEQFQQYRDVQDSGLYNMFTPEAREMTSLSKDEWVHIIRNYSELKQQHEGGDE